MKGSHNETIFRNLGKQNPTRWQEETAPGCRTRSGSCVVAATGRT
ncbi:hypothetical protein ACSSV8_003683 [Roseovarius sp. MBR-79]|jgi:hypothetical protein